MLRNFADWLRLARPELTSELVTLRWAAVDAFKQGVDAQTALDLVRISYKLTLRDQGVRQRLESALQVADAAFPMRDNDYELQIIAASVAMSLLDAPTEVADVIALAISAGNAQDFRDPAVLPELVPRAEKYLIQRGTALRRTSPVARMQVAPTVVKAVNDYTKSDVSTRDATQALKAISTAVQALSDGVNTVADTSSRSVATLLERSEMLWYMMTSHDLVSGQSLKSFGDAAPLIIAADMSTITQFRVPPAAVRAMMLRILAEALGRKTVKAIPAADAVAALNAEARGRYLHELPLHVTAHLCPLHEAIASASQHPTSDFSDSLGFDGRAAWEAEQLAYQAYTERLLIAATAQVK